MATYSRPSIQNAYSRWFWIRKNKCIIEFNKKSDIDKIYSYAKDFCESKYQHLIKKGLKIGIGHFNDPKAFIEYSNDIQDVYKEIKKYNPYKREKY